MGLFTVYAVGFLGYLFVPAQGAYLTMQGAFVHQIAGGWITRLNDTVVRRGSIGIDVFPSLHIAVSTFILLFDRHFVRWRYYAYLGPAIGLWIATLYLRYHYGIDVVVGFVLALFVVWGVTREEPFMSSLVTPRS
jgi:membrane-associated phospholipid phosphatase